MDGVSNKINQNTKDINSLEDELVFQNEKLKKENSKLSKELQKSRGMIWILSQAIKVSGTVDSFKNAMKKITDIIMGIMGVDTCTIWLKEDVGYTSYSRSVYSGNEYKVSEEELPEFLLKIKQTSVFDVSHNKINFCKGKNVHSILIAPLEDFRLKKRTGIIVVEHKDKDFFNQSTIDFFEILSVQISTITVNARVFEKVNEVTNKDSLTECYNRNYLEKLMLDINMNKKYYTLAVFDLDNFKKVNDLFGHEKGDEVLVEVSNLAINTVKKYKGDVIRYGGDEFVIILIMKLDEAKVILEDFRQKVRQLEIMKQIGIDVTVTIGVASYPETVPLMDEIFTIADNALVQGKRRNMKNRIHIGYS
ncbi:MAG: sensor domain-containing diguanylate cyclase [Marinisporobacter sp.]|jgi:diguanylate cyclase (GGDEF)-like protein|nr:sensor domain-containing diguanylate cyclase [Marinisporobacter sp.]